MWVIYLSSLKIVNILYIYTAIYSSPTKGASDFDFFQKWPTNGRNPHAYWASVWVTRMTHKWPTGWNWREPYGLKLHDPHDPQMLADEKRMTHMTHTHQTNWRETYWHETDDPHDPQAKSIPDSAWGEGVGPTTKGLKFRSVHEKFFIFCKTNCQAILDGLSIQLCVLTLQSTSLGVKPAFEDVVVRNFLAFCLTI